MRQSGYRRIVNKPFFGKEIVGYGICRRGCEECSEVYGHVKYREGRIAHRRIAGFVVQVSHQHLQVAFEKPRPHGYQKERGEHYRQRECSAVQRQRQTEVSGKHYCEAVTYHLPVAEAVGKYSAYQRHEIDCGEKTAVNCGGVSFTVKTSECV